MDDWTSSPPTPSRNAVRAAVRRPGPTGQLRPVHLPRPARPRVLGEVGTRCRRHRGHAAHRSRPDPYDKALTDLVGELSTRSDAFRVRWAAHDVRLHRTGQKHRHPVVGELHLSYEVMDLP